MRPFPVAKYSSPAASSPKEVNVDTRKGSRRTSVAFPSLHAQAPDDSGAIVAEEIAAGCRGHGPTAVHVPTCHRTVAFVMAEGVNRCDEPARSERGVRIARGALKGPPPVVGECRDLGTRPVVDLFPVALSHVADVEVAVRTVEREAPGIAEPEPDDLPPSTASQRIDPEQLAELLVHVLGAIAGISGRASVTHPDVEPSARVELELAAVVI